MEDRICPKCGETMQFIDCSFLKRFVCNQCRFLIGICKYCGAELRGKVEEYARGSYCYDCESWGCVTSNWET
jgi:hypothetical protein